MLGVAPNPSPDGSNWTVLVASEKAEYDDEDPGLKIVAFTEDVDDLPEVTDKEVRFDLYEDSAGGIHAIYASVILHRHGSGGECETFEAADETTDYEDVPDDLVNCVEGIMEFDVHDHGDGPIDATPLRVSDVEDHADFQKQGEI